MGRAGTRGDRHGHRPQSPVAGRASRLAGHRDGAGPESVDPRGGGQARPRAAEQLSDGCVEQRHPSVRPPRSRSDGVAVHDLRGAPGACERSQPSLAWLALYGVDGTTLRVPDSTDNAGFFGYSHSVRGQSAYPMARGVGLMALRSHLLAAVAFGPNAAG